MKNFFEDLGSLVVAFIRMLVFLPRALRYAGHKPDAAVEFRDSKPDSDTLPLIQLLAKKNPGQRVWIIVQKPSEASDYVASLQAACPDASLKLGKVTQAFLHARLVFLVDNPNSERLMIRLSRLLNRKQKFYRINHGLITKKIPTEVKYGDQPPWRRSAKSVDAVICQNWIESYRRSCFYKIPLSKTLRCGYPRFYRARELLTAQQQPLLPAGFSERCSGDHFKVMYAPTRSGSLTELADFDAEKLHAWLVEKNAYLYLKTHVAVSSIKGFDKISDRIVDLAGTKLVGSLDAVFMMDALITDTSSIMMEGFALDKPVIHVVVDHLDIATAHDALAYDEPLALPGLTARSFCAALKHLDAVYSKEVSNDFAKTVWNLVPEKSIEKAYADITG